MSNYKRLTERRGNLIIDNCGNCPNVNNPQGCTDNNCYEIIKNRLVELEDKIMDGTLVELPCKVGDTVYWVTGLTVEKHIVEGFHFDSREPFGLHLILQEMEPSISYFLGERLFFNKAEAEAKLKELQEEKNE